MSRDFWTIEEGKILPEQFFRLVPRYFPEATTAYFEGTSIDREVKNLYQRFEEKGPYLPGRATLWPRAKLYRCQFSDSLFNELAHLGGKLAEPELMDHLSIYCESSALLQWHDAFGNVMILAKSLSEETVANFAGELGVEYG